MHPVTSGNPQLPRLYYVELFRLSDLGIGHDVINYNALIAHLLALSPTHVSHADDVRIRS